MSDIMAGPNPPVTLLRDAAADVGQMEEQNILPEQTFLIFSGGILLNKLTTEVIMEMRIRL